MQKFVTKRRVLTCSVVLLAAAACHILPTYAQPAAHEAVRDGAVFRVTRPESRLVVVERFSKVVELQTKIVRVDGFDPEIIDVTALTPNQVRVQALKPGVTTMVLLDERNQTYTLDVFITGDVRHLQAYLQQLFPKASVQAFEVRESVVLRGWVTQPEHITEMIDVAEQFYPRVINQIRVGGVQQVMLNVRVMEVQRSKLRRLGFNFLYLNPNGYLLSTPGNLVIPSMISLSDGAGPAVDFVSGSLADPTVSFGIVDQNNLFQGFLEALKIEGLLKIKAEPSLVTTNGRPASMLSGGEFPILVPQSLGTTTIEWREFGVRMQAVPIILGNGRVRLELEPEVSERDFANSVEVGGSIVPGLTTRRANTQVEMSFGQTLVIAGLISWRDTANYSKVPLLGDIPYLSFAFSRKRYEEVETELVITVTPELVAPMDEGQLPPGGPGLFSDAPTFREMCHGQIEVPLCGDECEGCGLCGYGSGGHCIDPNWQGASPQNEYAPAGESPPAPPAPVGDEAAEPEGNPVTQTLNRLNPFRKRTTAKRNQPVGVRNVSHFRQGSQPPAKQAGYQTDNARRPYVQQLGGPVPGGTDAAKQGTYGGQYPNPGLIEP